MSTSALLSTVALVTQQNEAPSNVAGPLITASATVSVAFISAALIYLAGKRDRRRELYGKAFQAAIAWEELYFRVLRREQGFDKELVDRFHTIQEDIAFHTGWIGSESEIMRRRYLRLATLVKSTLAPHIRDAWSTPPRPPNETVQPVNEIPFPSLNAEHEKYLRDVRSHLSIFLIPRLALAIREHFEELARPK
ncbi:hypothetical protein [Amycolatopsis nivea]|uniref:hypothetical protein n=1 Tax=Amycolatopsis nivea TaxID=1644109 RepID=UPI00107002DC|nr:hypothetical protein [Amycolatopsis nivea]